MCTENSLIIITKIFVFLYGNSKVQQYHIQWTKTTEPDLPNGLVSGSVFYRTVSKQGPAFSATANFPSSRRGSMTAAPYVLPLQNLLLRDVSVLWPWPKPFSSSMAFRGTTQIAVSIISLQFCMYKRSVQLGALKLATLTLVLQFLLMQLLLQRCIC